MSEQDYDVRVLELPGVRVELPGLPRMAKADLLGIMTAIIGQPYGVGHMVSPVSAAERALELLEAAEDRAGASPRMGEWFEEVEAAARQALEILKEVDRESARIVAERLEKCLGQVVAGEEIAEFERPGPGILGAYEDTPGGG